MKGWRRHGLRLVVCAALGLAAGFAARIWTPSEIALALGWDVAALTYIVRVWMALSPVPAKEIKTWSRREDEGRGAITIILTFAVAASFLAIFDMISGKSNGVQLALAAFTILCSWTLLHTAFAAHYAHRCFDGGPDTPAISFEGEPPRFIDFAYYAFTVGMTFQVSDTDTQTSAMRRLTLIHGVVSFVFNTVIIAISVGVASSLIGGN
ncbi:DUF1345 domain-containing protein [Hansschlegelia plantiphila]|uniref:Membrane protein n=1 Tax=Hansschlegelia plantiphila TaxID=374655 RepID=A0A9W6J2X9_9HYPH|nr:DUF1345 domain-containing protein [Hansschlegelia plantiphila]GLK69352.1 membrane protein [Hansschlegelia plantiphila]